MAGEVAAERLYVQIVADASGFRADLEEKVRAAAAKAKATVRVRARVDEKQLAVEARRAAREARDEAAVRVRAEFSARQVRDALNRAVREGHDTQAVRGRVEFNGTQVRAALQRAIREGGQGGDAVRARVEFSAAQARAALQSAVRQATAQEGARARVEFSAPQVRNALQQVLREGAETGEHAVFARVRFSAIQVRAALAEAIREGVQNRAVTARIEFDPAQVRAALQRAVRQATAGGAITARLTADVTRFREEVRMVRQRAEAIPVRMRIWLDTGGVANALRAAGTALRTLSMGPAIASGILVLAGALTNLVGGLYAVISAASQAAGTLAILPGLFASLAQGVAVLAFGFSGLSGALQAMEAAEKQSATAAQRGARAHSGAANQVAAAQERLAEAREDAARRIAAAEQQAARSIEDAERSRADAVQQARRAEEELSRARQQAREDIQQLAFSLREASLSEEQAQINLERAQARLLAAQQDAKASPLDRRQAELDYRQAILDLDEAKDRTADLSKENERARRLGVEGADNVRQAREQLTDANRAVADAERNLAQTRADAAAEVAEAREAASRQIRDAQRAIDSAMASTASQAATTGAAMGNLDYAMGKLSPAGRRFAKFLYDRVIPALREVRDSVQAAFLPRMERAIRAAMPLLGVLEAGFVRSAETIGDLAVRFGELAGSAPFRRDTATIMASNDRVLESFGNTLFYLAEALRHVMVVAAPFTERFAELVEEWAKGRAEAAATGRATGEMADFFERAWETGGQLVGILADLWAAMRNVGRAAMPAGDTMLDALARGAERLREWTEDPANAQRLTEFFNNTVPVMEEFARLLGDIVALFGRLGEVTGGHAMDGLFFVLEKFIAFLDQLTYIPGAGTILTTILVLAGAGFGLGVVARALGKIGSNLGRLGRYTGLTQLFGMLTGGGRDGPSRVGRLADDVGRLTEEIEREIPKDREKQRELDRVGESAGGARKPVSGVAGDVWVAGNSAEEGAKKTSRMSRALDSLKGVAGKAGVALAGLGGLLVALPGVGGTIAKLGNALKTAFSKIKLPGGAAGAARGGILGGAVGGLLGKLPSLSGVLGRVRGWFSGLLNGIKSAAGKIFSKGALANIGKGAAGGAARGTAGGPIGIIGGILAGVLGSLIGGGQGGARGAIGGAIGGGAAGAGIGATIGSIVPGLGTAIGAAIGGAIGVAVGAITGGNWWGKIGDFFTKTLPNFIVDQLRQVPGRMTAMLRGGVNLAAGLISWAGDQLMRFSEWLGEQALATIRKLPVLIVDALFALPVLISRAAAAAPLVFGWILEQAWNLLPKLATWATWLPRTLVKLILGGAFKAGQVFGWILSQAASLPGQLWGLLRSLPGLIMHALRNPGDVWKWLKDQAASLSRTLPNLIMRALRAVANAMGIGLGDAAKRVRERMAEMTRNFGLSGDRWKALWRNTTSAINGTVRTAFNYVRDFIGRSLDRTRDKIGGVLNWISRAFRSARDNITSAWRPLGRMLAGPVNWIGLNVYNRGIKWAWDRVAGLVNKGKLPAYSAFAQGGSWLGRVLPGYTPGRDVHRFVSPTGGVIDMSGGEAIMVPEWTAAVGTARIKIWNKLARRGGPQAVAAAMAQDFTGPRGARRYARGGVWGAVPSGVPHAAFDIGGLWRGVKGFLGDLKDGFYGGLARAASKVLDPILNAVSRSMGAGSWGELLRAVPKAMTEPFLAWLTKAIEPKLGGDAKGVVKAAASMIGTGDDRGPNNNWITRKWGLIGEPWCAMFVSEAISKAKAAKYYPGHPSAAVKSFVDAMKHVGRGDGRPGDLAAYRGTGHINIIEKKSGGGYQTIGGNENALIRRSTRGGQSSILRPKFAGGGVFTRDLISNAVRIFKFEAPRQFDAHEMDTPLVEFMNRLSPAMIRKVTEALVKTGTSIGPPLLRDSGGPLPPGGLAYNGLNDTEWVLTPEAVDLLGGPAAVQSLNRTASLYRSSRPAIKSTLGGEAATAPAATVNVFPQPRQSEHEIGTVAARRLGAMLR